MENRKEGEGTVPQDRGPRGPKEEEEELKDQRERPPQTDLWVCYNPVSGSMPTVTQ